MVCLLIGFSYWRKRLGTEDEEIGCLSRRKQKRLNSGGRDNKHKVLHLTGNWLLSSLRFFFSKCDNSRYFFCKNRSHDFLYVSLSFGVQLSSTVFYCLIWLVFLQLTTLCFQLIQWQTSKNTQWILAPKITFVTENETWTDRENDGIEIFVFEKVALAHSSH